MRSSQARPPSESSAGAVAFSSSRRSIEGRRPRLRSRAGVLAFVLVLGCSTADRAFQGAEDAERRIASSAELALTSTAAVESRAGETLAGIGSTIASARDAVAGGLREARAPAIAAIANLSSLAGELAGGARDARARLDSSSSTPWGLYLGVATLVAVLLHAFFLWFRVRMLHRDVRELNERATRHDLDE